VNDYARDVLKRLIDEFGVDLARDIHKLGASLRDECGECKRGIDAQGNRSAPYDARFTAIPASGARFAR
jgi:hypothetical protein